MPSSEDRFAEAPFQRLLSIRVVDAGAGLARVAATAGASVTQGFGRVHGGFVATLLDTAAACAVRSVIGEGRGFTSIEFKVNFLRAAGSGEVAAEARVVKAGRRVQVVEGTAFDSRGQECARYLGTFIATDDTEPPGSA